MATPVRSQKGPGQRIRPNVNRRRQSRYAAISFSSKTRLNPDFRIIRYDELHECALGTRGAVTLETAGAAIRRWRERELGSLDVLSARTGINKMALSYLERGMKNPRRKTIIALENGAGWPSGSYNRLVTETEDPHELDKMIKSFASAPPPVRPLVAQRISGTDLFEGFAEAQIDNLNAVIAQLPAATDPNYERYVLTALELCAKAETLAANSWQQIVARSDPSAAQRLMAMVANLDSTRISLLARVPESLAARFDQACRALALPDSIIAILAGLSADEVWELRTRGRASEDAAAAATAFLEGIAARTPPGPPVSSGGGGGV